MFRGGTTYYTIRKMKRQERNGSQIKNGFTAYQSKNGEELSYLHASSFLASLLVFLCPVFAMFFVYIIVELNGDVYSFYTYVQANGLAAVFQQAVLDHIMGSRKAWTIIFSLAAFELALMKLLPGRMIKGPITPNGNVPVYKANGLLAFCVSLFLYILLAYLKVFSPSDIYDNYLDIIGALNILSLVFVFILYIKGRFAPSSSDNSVSGIFLFDFFWGTELYPRIFGWDIKMFTNCRFGLMAWSLLLVTYTWKQYEMYGWVDSMLVSVGIQLVYLAKFYHWEMGYMKSLDIMHDRAGFYIVSFKIYNFYITYYKMFMYE